MIRTCSLLCTILSHCARSTPQMLSIPSSLSYKAGKDRPSHQPRCIPLSKAPPRVVPHGLQCSGLLTVSASIHHSLISFRSEGRPGKEIQKPTSAVQSSSNSAKQASYKASRGRPGLHCRPTRRTRSRARLTRVRESRLAPRPHSATHTPSDSAPVRCSSRCRGRRR